MDHSEDSVPQPDDPDEFNEEDFDDDFDDDFEEETEEELQDIEAPHEGDFTSPPDFGGTPNWDSASPDGSSGPAPDEGKNGEAE